MTATAVKAETSKRTVAASIARQAAAKAAAKSAAKAPAEKPAKSPTNSTVPKNTEKKAPKRELQRPTVPDKPGALTVGQFNWTAPEVAAILKAYGTWTEKDVNQILADHFKGFEPHSRDGKEKGCDKCGLTCRRACALHVKMMKAGGYTGRTYLAPRDFRNARWILQQWAAKNAPATETK